MSLINKDIDTILIQSLSIDDLRIFCQTNKYYNQLIRQTLQEYYDFYTIIDTIVVYDYINTNKVLMKAIKIGNLNVCKYLFNKYKCDIHALNDLAFQLSCQYGHLYIAKWLLSSGNVDIHANNDPAFQLSCYNGHLNVAKWLLSLGNFNIRAYDDYAFKLSCEKGHLNVAQSPFGPTVRRCKQVCICE